MVLNTGTNLRVHALTADNHLLSFSQANNVFQPNTVTDLAITGLSTGEDLLGVDVRPANGMLYGVSSLNRVYVINTTTGLATLSSTLVADAADTTAPFTTVAAGETLGISIKTVEKHRQQVMNKLNIHDVAGLTRYAISRGIIESTPMLAGGTT